MLTELCQELHNWFDRERLTGTFTIEGGNITAPFLVDGQYFRIIGSLFNDGVWQYGAGGLTDETFDGAVWSMAIPKAVLDLAEEIDAWNAKYGGVEGVAMSPFTSESFGGYSYSKTSSGSSVSAQAATWQQMFARRLNRWRKL